jgi:hypothetical protein
MERTGFEPLTVRLSTRLAHAAAGHNVQRPAESLARFDDAHRVLDSGRRIELGACVFVRQAMTNAPVLAPLPRAAITIQPGPAAVPWDNCTGNVVESSVGQRLLRCQAA